MLRFFQGITILLAIILPIVMHASGSHSSSIAIAAEEDAIPTAPTLLQPLNDTPGRPSVIRVFKFDWNAAPKLLTPLNLIETPFTPEFIWSAVESTHSYQIEISTQPDFSAAKF